MTWTFHYELTNLGVGRSFSFCLEFGGTISVIGTNLVHHTMIMMDTYIVFKNKDLITSILILTRVPTFYYFQE